MITALILVDLQNDFMPGGNLAVKDGDLVLPVVNRLMGMPFDVKVATKDWHPANHGSFAANHDKQPGDHMILEGLDQILWPVHCVQGTSGAEFNPKWHAEKVDKIIFKGTDPGIDSYSTFFDNGHKKATGLHEYLKSHGVKEIYVAGLATDYCVKYSVLDALNLGYKVYVIQDACKAVNLSPDDEKKAYEDMFAAGAHIINSSEIGKSIQEEEKQI